MEAFILVLGRDDRHLPRFEVFLAQPRRGGRWRGAGADAARAGALFLAIGILGATVMPHNLYLHSALVQSRRVRRHAGGDPRRHPLQH